METSWSARSAGCPIRNLLRRRRTVDDAGAQLASAALGCWAGARRRRRSVSTTGVDASAQTSSAGRAW